MSDTPRDPKPIPSTSRSFGDPGQAPTAHTSAPSYGGGRALGAPTDDDPPQRPHMPKWSPEDCAKAERNAEKRATLLPRLARQHALIGQTLSGPLDPEHAVNETYLDRVVRWRVMDGLLRALELLTEGEVDGAVNECDIVTTVQHAVGTELQELLEAREAELAEVGDGQPLEPGMVEPPSEPGG